MTDRIKPNNMTLLHRSVPTQDHAPAPQARVSQVHRCFRFAVLSLSTFALVTTLSACAVINQGEVGVKRRAGKIEEQALPPGLVAYDVVLTDIIHVPVRTVNREVKLSLPSKDGLNIDAEISILYRVLPDKATEVIGDIGENYEESVVLTVFRSAAADTCAKFLAKDMYTGRRKDIEHGIRDAMMAALEPRGFAVEAVLLKSIRLPDGLTKAIEWKLQADQDAQRMEFTLKRERLEAERKQVEAEGIREAQKIIADGLTGPLLEWQSIQAFRELATSNNAKVIITDGDSPLVLNPGTGPTSAH